MVNFKNTRCQTQRQTAEINAAERQRENSQRSVVGSRRTEYNNQRNDKKAINYAFRSCPENFSKGE